MSSPTTRFPAGCLPRCQNPRPPHDREISAAVLMLDPEGKPVPGGFYCELCSSSAIAEYAEKLGETWSAVELEEA